MSCSVQPGWEDGWEIKRDDRRTSTEELVATARLFRSAPDLLEALEEARKTIQALIEDGYLGYLNQRGRIDAAIAKAYGEDV